MTGPASPRRRAVLKALAGLGVGGPVLHRAVAAAAEAGDVSPEMVRRAEWIAGVEFTDAGPLPAWAIANCTNSSNAIGRANRYPWA